MIFMGKQKTKVSALAKHPVGVKTPPYSTIGKGNVGGDACIAPQVGVCPSGPMTSIGPYSMGVEEFRPRRGQYGEQTKSVKKNAVIPAFFSFWPVRPLLWGSQGRVAPEAGFAASQQRDFFASFLVTKRKVLKAICRYTEGLPQGGNPDQPPPIASIKHHVKPYKMYTHPRRK